MSGPGRSLDLGLPFTRDEIVLRQRYEALSILNDLAIAVWFIVGSVLFFSESLTYAGTWCFLLGSIQLAVRPLLRLGRQVHLQRHHRRHGDARGAADRTHAHESDDDF